MADVEFPLLEICVDNLQSIRNAIDGGANRLELCSALTEGGLTPSCGLAGLARRTSQVPLFAMLRIRGGNFVYEQEEIEAMATDLQALKNIGMDGFVFGALTSDGRIDQAACDRIIKLAHPLPVTFHRAFDEVKDPMQSLDELQRLGFARILTSGQKKSALEGADLIKQLVDLATGRIVVMPGAGVTPENIANLRLSTGAKEFHGSAKKSTTADTNFGLASGPITLTDTDTVRRMLKNLKDVC